MTLTEHPSASARACCADCPHCPARRSPGLADPRAAAAFFTAYGITAASFRQPCAPAGLADAMDALAAEGLDQAACRELLGLDPLPAGGAL